MSEGRLIAELKSHTLSRLLLLGEKESGFFLVFWHVSPLQTPFKCPSCASVILKSGLIS